MNALKKHTFFLFFLLLTSVSVLSSNNPFVFKNARFTFISSGLVRMEYAYNGKFVDEPTLFAFNREARCDSFKLEKLEDNVYLFTSRKMQIRYVENGLPFSNHNISILVYRKTKDFTWTWSTKDDKNLGGTLTTLDGVGSEVPVDNGLLTRNGCSVIDDSRKEILKDDWIAERPVEHLVDKYFFAYDTDYKGALRDLTKISGSVPMPRKHVFGSWYCRWWDYSDDEFRQIVKEYKEHDFPLDILVMDMGWHTQHEATTGTGHAWTKGWTGYTWNKKLIKDPEKLIKDLKDDRIFVTLNDHPADGIRHHEAYYAPFMQSMGEDTLKQKELLFNAGSKKYMDNFFKFAHSPLEKQGIDFWWLDWQQDYIYPTVQGFRELKHLPWLNYLYYQHSSSNNKRGLIFSRWAGWGSQRYPIQFSGDARGTWEMLKFEVKFTASSSNACCFLWAHDTGGFYGERDPEMYIRWTQFALTNASLRIHSLIDSELDRRPWLWGDEAEKAMKVIYHMRSQLMPYIYSSAWQCHDKTLPLISAMYIDYPDDSIAYDQPQQYMFGNAFLAAPITNAGIGKDKVASQKVWFPKGVWYNVFDGKRHNGNTIDSITCNIYETPLFVKGGVPVPMQPYTQRMATENSDTLIVKCYPAEENTMNSFDLYEDDGQSKEYENGKYSITKIVYEQKLGKAIVTIHPSKGSFEGQKTQKSLRLELPATQKATACKVNGKTRKYFYNNQTNTNVVIVPKQSVDNKIVIEMFVKEKNQ